jgi:hypothetical protein
VKTQILLTIEHDKEVPDLLDKVAGRAYTLDGVKDVKAELPDLVSLPVVEMAASGGSAHNFGWNDKDDAFLIGVAAGIGVCLLWWWLV